MKESDLETFVRKLADQIDVMLDHRRGFGRNLDHALISVRERFVSETARSRLVAALEKHAMEIDAIAERARSANRPTKRRAARRR
jgi:hypothetical protein